MQIACAKAQAAPKRNGFVLRNFKASRRVKLVYKGRYGVECLLGVALHHHGLNIGIEHAGRIDLFEQRGDVGLVLVGEYRRAVAALNAGRYLRKGCAIGHFCKGRQL